MRNWQQRKNIKLNFIKIFHSLNTENPIRFTNLLTCTQIHFPIKGFTICLVKTENLIKNIRREEERGKKWRNHASIYARQILHRLTRDFDVGAQTFLVTRDCAGIMWRARFFGLACAARIRRDADARDTVTSTEHGAGRYTLNIVQSTLSIGPNLCWVRQQREPTPDLLR